MALDTGFSLHQMIVGYGMLVKVRPGKIIMTILTAPIKADFVVGVGYQRLTMAISAFDISRFKRMKRPLTEFKSDSFMTSKAVILPIILNQIIIVVIVNSVAR